MRKEVLSSMRRQLVALFLLSTVGVTFTSALALAGGGPKNVLLVVNENSPTSQAIAEYYRIKRGIPERNICRISCTASEWVSKAECEAQIVAPIRNFLETSGVHDRIDYIVLTKDIPLKASYYDSGWNGEVSVASILTCVGVPSITSPCNNPYGPTAYPPAPVQYFSHQLSFSGKSYYIVTRLDGYNLGQIFRMIDDSVSAVGSNGSFLLDGRYESDPNSAFYKANNRLREANRNLGTSGFSTYYNASDFDLLINEFVGNQQGLMGYFSWGSNEFVSYTPSAYTSNYFVPGSIADTFVSTSGRTFTYPPSVGQSLMADLIPQGVCAVNGYVSEPDIRYATYPNVLFDRYTKGYNMGESFFAATPRLYWKAVTVGDPLMAPYATPPNVMITSPSSESPVNGSVLVSACASDESGISKVEFYIDDFLVATCNQAPFEFLWDTTKESDGTHIIEAIAYENSPVFTQGMSVARVQVSNTPVNVVRVSDIKNLPDGTLIQLTSKPVIAGCDVFTDCVYVCEPDRSAGIRVEGANGLITGALATVWGEVVTRNGEKVITRASGVVEGSTVLPTALATPNVWVANKRTASPIESNDLVPGLPNTGLLVKTWGYVVQVEADGFYISDESRSWMDIDGRIKVCLQDLVERVPLPAQGSYVGVVGVSCYNEEGGLLRPAIRPRMSSDVSIMSPTIISIPMNTSVQGWNMMSIPGILPYPRMSQVFVGIDIDGGLLFVDPIKQRVLAYDTYNPSHFPPFSPGIAFWFYSSKATELKTAVMINEPSCDFWISIPSAVATVFGYPFQQGTNLQNCLLSDGSETVTIVSAANKGWISQALYSWNNISGSLETLDVADPYASLEPWKGYWLCPRKPNLALIIPHP